MCVRQSEDESELETKATTQNQDQAAAREPQHAFTAAQLPTRKGYFDIWGQNHKNKSKIQAPQTNLQLKMGWVEESRQPESRRDDL